jgi:hypothetical protein
MAIQEFSAVRMFPISPHQPKRWGNHSLGTHFSAGRFQLVRINPSGGELGFRTTTQQGFQTPNRRTPLIKKSTWEFLPK